MNYRHIYHAGNFADIVKHITLISLVNHLKQKEKPFAVLDAFAGIGLYDLTKSESIRGGETLMGIDRLLQIDSLDDPLLAELTMIYKSLGDRVYPGSPWIISCLLRCTDRLIANELHPEDFQELKSLFRSNRQVAVHNIDAYNAVKAFVPFPEKRGLVLLDPPFEIKGEFEKLIGSVEIIQKRASSMTTMIWYPVKYPDQVQTFYQSLKSLGLSEILIIEFELLGQISGLTKCAVAIINPPYIKPQITQSLQLLTQKAYKDFAVYACKML